VTVRLRLATLSLWLPLNAQQRVNPARYSRVVIGVTQFLLLVCVCTPLMAQPTLTVTRDPQAVTLVGPDRVASREHERAVCGAMVRPVTGTEPGVL